MAPLIETRPATTKEVAIFQSRRKKRPKRQEPLESELLAEKVVSIMRESESGVAALVFEEQRGWKSVRREAANVGQNLRGTMKRMGVNIRTAVECQRGSNTATLIIGEFQPTPSRFREVISRIKGLACSP